MFLFANEVLSILVSVFLIHYLNRFGDFTDSIVFSLY